MKSRIHIALGMVVLGTVGGVSVAGAVPAATLAPNPSLVERAQVVIQRDTVVRRPPVVVQKRVVVKKPAVVVRTPGVIVRP